MTNPTEALVSAVSAVLAARAGWSDLGEALDDLAEVFNERPQAREAELAALRAQLTGEVAAAQPAPLRLVDSEAADRVDRFLRLFAELYPTAEEVGDFAIGAVLAPETAERVTLTYEDLKEVAHTAQAASVLFDEPAPAREGDWDVDAFVDDAGHWVALEVFDPRREQGADEQVTAAVLLLSDVEAQDLSKQLANPTYRLRG